MKKILTIMFLATSLFLVAACDDDETKPVVTITEGNVVEFELGSTCTTDIDWKTYFTVNDNVDGDITVTDEMITWKDDKAFECTAGTYTLILSVKDAAGNTADIEEITITVNPDTTAPSSDLLTVNDGAATDAVVVADGAIVGYDVTVLVPSESDIASASYTIDGVAGDTITLGTAFTVSAEGVYIVTFKDTADNAATYTFTIDKTAPTFTDFVSSEEVYINEATSWVATVPTYADANDVTLTVEYFNTTCFAENAIDLDGARNLLLTADNVVCVQYTITDAAGNTSTETTTVTALSDWVLYTSVYANYTTDVSAYSLDLLNNSCLLDDELTEEELLTCVNSGSLEMLSLTYGSIYDTFALIEAELAYILTLDVKYGVELTYDSYLTYSAMLVTVTRTEAGHNIIMVIDDMITIEFNVELDQFVVTGKIDIEYTEEDGDGGIYTYTELWYFDINETTFSLFVEISDTDGNEDVLVYEFQILENGYNSISFKEYSSMAVEDYYCIAYDDTTYECTDYLYVSYETTLIFELYGYGSSESTTFTGGTYGYSVIDGETEEMATTFATYFYNNNSQMIEHYQSEVYYADYDYTEYVEGFSYDLGSISGYTDIIEVCLYEEEGECWEYGYILADANGDALTLTEAYEYGEYEVYIGEYGIMLDIMLYVDEFGTDYIFNLTDCISELSVEMSAEDFNTNIASAYATAGNGSVKGSLLSDLTSIEDLYTLFGIEYTSVVE